MCTRPAPRAGAGHGRIEPEGRHADVPDCPDNFSPHVRDPSSNPSRQWLHPAHPYAQSIQSELSSTLM